MSSSILITGGAGFIGSSLAIALRTQFADARVVAFDNLRRRGSELNLPRLRQAGVEFVHGDVRAMADLEAAGKRFDALIECSAEPSVLAGSDGQVRYVIDANLMGLVNCLELARHHQAAFLFLSTSRVYPIRLLSGLHTEVRGKRLELRNEQSVPGVSAEGISEAFPLEGARTLYGATKLAGELLIAEYVDMFGLRAVINRCSVVAGPWQMGKVDQGVFALWAFAHLFNRPLSYIGFGGAGIQVRDAVHVDDLCDLILRQLAHPEALTGEVFNVGGGRKVSASLAELTDICERLTGTSLSIASVQATRLGDVPIYLTDARKVRSRFGWTPSRGLETLMSDIVQWASEHRDALREVVR